MLTNEEIIELYGNHPDNENYDKDFGERYILCENCPLHAIDCTMYSSERPCTGEDETYSRIRKWAETEGAVPEVEVAEGVVSAVKVSLDDGAIMPTYAHPGWDAGMDLYAREDAYRWRRRSFDTGVHIQIPKGYAGIVTGKSGLDHKHGITCHGLVDAGYTGSVRVNLYNSSDVDYPVKAGDKIAQLVIVPVLTPELVLVEEIDGSERGDAGFGSTGR